MDRKFIDDHHVVARYLADQLADAEREAFEAYYLEHPEILAEMEAVARLKAGLRTLQARGELATLLRRSSYLRAVQIFAAAASLLLTVALVLFVSRDRAEQPVLAASVVSATTSTYTILRTRGAALAARIEIGRNPGAVELLVLPEYGSPGSRYRLALAAVDDAGVATIVAELTDLAPTSDGFVRAYVNAARVAPGRYQLLLTEAAPPARSSAFDVTIVGAN